jgi:hypothetical protein
MGDILIVGWGEGAEAFGRELRAAILERLPFASIGLRFHTPPAGGDEAARVAARRLAVVVTVCGRGDAAPSAEMAGFVGTLFGLVPHAFTVALERAGGMPPALAAAVASRPLLMALPLDQLIARAADLATKPFATSGSVPPPAALPDPSSPFAVPERAGAEPPDDAVPPRAGRPPGLDAFAPPESIEGTLSEKAPTQPTEVLLGASAPSAVPPGDEFTARFIASLPQDEARIRADLARIAAGDAVHLGVKRCRWQRGTEVTVALAGRHLDVSPTPQRFVWNDESVVLEFDVAVGADAPVGRTVLKFDVAIDGIVVAMLRINLEITAGPRDDRPAADRAVAARTAFASYSSRDRARVLDRVAAVRIAAGLDVFLDCLSLNPGEAWKPRLAGEIRARDLFLLFWSPDSAQSQWVEWEWRTALAEKGEAAMQLHPLATGVMPPEELKHLHFGDVYMLVREAGEAKKPPPAG